MTKLDETIAALKAFDLQAVQAELENLRAIRDWAMAQLEMDFRPGDRVVIACTDPSEVGGGWDCYREALAPGQTGIAGEITFNQYRCRWQTRVAMDRTWSVHEHGGFSKRVVRYWNGPADETPEGYEPPSAYDQENHPEGRAMHFAMDVRWLAKAEPAP